MSGSNEHTEFDLLPMRARVAAILDAIPYARHLGMHFSEQSDGAVFHLPFDAKLIGNVSLPAIHGGVVASFMETAALAATYVLLPENIPPKLVDFSIDFLSSARPTSLYAQCEMHRVGRRIAAVGVRCWQESSAAPVAVARAHVFVAQSSSDAGVPSFSVR